MPLYEYHCKSCDHRFEQIQKFSDSPVRDCPQCGQPAVEQLVSAPAVQFKGTGWYVTDYARKGSKDPSAPASGGASAEKSESSAPAASAATSAAPADKPAGSTAEKHASHSTEKKKK